MAWLLVLAACTRTNALGDSRRAAAIAAAEAVDPSTLMPDIEALVAARSEDEPEPHSFWWSDDEYPLTDQGSAAYVAARFADIGVDVALETAENGAYTTTNVVATIPGRTEDVVLLSAHHDAWWSGADDNASGVAVLLAAAAALRDAELDRTVRIVAFDREEVGLVGAVDYLDAHADETIVGNVNLDCVAYTDHAPGSQSSIPGVTAPDTGDFLAAIASEPATDMVLGIGGLAPDLPDAVDVVGLVSPGDGHYPLTYGLTRSDHAVMWGAGIPAIFLTDTANYRNPNYHRETDTIDTLDPDFLAGVARFTTAATAAWAVE